jgi:hypothetical protein
MSKSIQDILLKIEEERRRKELEKENELIRALERQRDEYLRRIQFPLKDIVVQNFSPLSIPISTGGRRKTAGTIISFVDGELSEYPAGVINGTNTVFILSFLPDPGSEHVYLNGLLQVFSIFVDYTLSGVILTFNDPPPATSILRVSYRVGEG